MPACAGRSGPDAACHVPRRAFISDGEQYGPAVLNSSCAELVTTEAVKLNQIVVLKEYIVSTVNSQK